MTVSREADKAHKCLLIWQACFHFPLCGLAVKVKTTSNQSATFADFSPDFDCFFLSGIFRSYLASDNKHLLIIRFFLSWFIVKPPGGVGKKIRKGTDLLKNTMLAILIVKHDNPKFWHTISTYYNKQQLNINVRCKCTLMFRLHVYY